MHTLMIELITYQDSNGKKPYADWLGSLTDKQAKARILVRVNRIAAGNFGDCKPLRDGVQELRIDHGPGYRVYLSRQGCCCCVAATSATKTALLNRRLII